MRALIVILLFNFMPKAFGVGDPSGSYAAAEDAWRQGDFAEAIRIYLAALQNGEENASLYYNLGTSLAKNGEMGSALAAFLRARSLNPTDPDIRYNVQFLQEKGRDKLDTRMPQDRWLDLSAARWWNEKALFWWTVGPLVLLLGLVGGHLFSGRAPLFTAGASAVLLLGALYAGCSLAHVLWWETDWGAVRAAEVDVLASPTAGNAVVIFQLHEGAPLAVINQSGDWFKIRLSDGKSGWIPREHLAIFGKNFFSYPTAKNEPSPENPAL